MWVIDVAFENRQKFSFEVCARTVSDAISIIKSRIQKCGRNAVICGWGPA